MGFRMRNVVEGFIMGIVAALLALAIPIESNSTRITVVVLFAAPFIILGAIGINGDPVSGFLKNVYHWKKQREVVLYNGSVRLLNESPVDIAMEQKDLHDRIVEIMEERRKRAAESEQNKSLIEGIDFEFAEDNDEKTALAKRKKPKESELSFEEYSEDELLSIDEDDIVFLDISDNMTTIDPQTAR